MTDTKLNKTQHKIYDILISSLAAAAVILVLIDLSEGLNEWQSRLDFGILTIFLIDYLVRLWVAPDKWKFVKTNICDLIAILPFHTIFRLFKAASLTKASYLTRAARLAKLPRLFAFLYRPLKKARRFLNTNGFKYVAFITTALIILGGILIHFAEGMSYGDGIWWAFVTTTTVGYGDISPSTFYGRMIAMVLMLVGIGLIGTVTSTLTSYFLNTGVKSVKNETLETIKTRLDDFEHLSKEDVDDICHILKALKENERNHQ
ncbi:MAG: potassium channel family protein [Lachnospiraceae bacterium]|nr:potassium channel family protein [Lachnospiraceae bacterium]